MNAPTQTDRAHVCTFTGHRPERLAFPHEDVIAWLKNEIRKAVDDGYTAFISGMQRGVDLWAAEEILRLRDAGEDLRLIAAVPFPGMERGWEEDWQKRYKAVLDRADETVVICDKPGRAAFFFRNYYMVDHASRLLAVYSGGGGGTLETMKYAQKQKIEVIRYGLV